MVWPSGEDLPRLPSGACARNSRALGRLSGGAFFTSYMYIYIYIYVDIDIHIPGQLCLTKILNIKSAY